MPHRLKPGGKYWQVLVVQGSLGRMQSVSSKPHKATLEAKSSYAANYATAVIAGFAVYWRAIESR
jgi:hypothetical protein